MSAITSLQVGSIPEKIPPYSSRKVPFCKKITGIANRFLHSNSLKTVMLGACVIGAVTILCLSEVVAISVIAGIIAGVALLALGMHIVANKKKIVYEISLFITLTLKHLKPQQRPWWSPVAPGLHLGAIPLKNFAHDEKIRRNLGVTAVLSLIEDFEFTTPGILSVPCVNLDWHEKGVRHLILHTTDFKAVPLEILERGVAFLEEQIDNNGNCYVHCKAGRGRSASVIVAYLMKKGIVSSVDEGVAYLKQKRPFISINVKKRHTLEHFFQKHCVNRSNAA